MALVLGHLDGIFSRAESVYGNQVILAEADPDLIFSMAFADTKAVTNTFDDGNGNGSGKQGNDSDSGSDSDVIAAKDDGADGDGDGDGDGDAEAEGEAHEGEAHEDESHEDEASCSEKKHHFFVKLMEKCGHSCIQFGSSNWQLVTNVPKSNSSRIIEPIYTRSLTIKTSPQSRFSLFPKKNSQFDIKQTKIEIQKEDLSNEIIIYNECTKRDCDSKLSSEYSIIEKWVISSRASKKGGSGHSQEEAASYSNVQCQVKFECGIILDDEDAQAQKRTKDNLSTIRTKVLRYCMQNFNEWRSLIKNEYLVNFHKMLPFLGEWNKLNSYFHIRIIENPNQIIYNDGSTFDVKIVNGDTMRAGYADGYFDAKIEANRNDSVLKWNNGSIWIRNGFDNFAGVYQCGNDNGDKELIEIDCKGFVIFFKGAKSMALGNANKCKGDSNADTDASIKLAENGSMKVRFVLTSTKSIMYIYQNHKMEGTGTFSNDQDCNIDSIKWTNGQIWQKLDGMDPSQAVISDAMFDEILSEIPKSGSNSPIPNDIETGKDNQSVKMSTVCAKKVQLCENNDGKSNGDEKESSNTFDLDEDNIIHINGFNDHYFNVTHFEFDCDCCQTGNGKEHDKHGKQGNKNDNTDNSSKSKKSTKYEGDIDKWASEEDSTQQDGQDWLLVDL